MSKGQDRVKYYEQLAGKRSNFDNTAQEIIDNMDPMHADVKTQRAPGEKKTSRIFDSTAAYGKHVLSQFVQSSTINQSQKWVSLTARDPTARAIQANADHFNNTRDKMLSAMRPTFYGPAGQAIDDWVTFGNGPLLIEGVPQKRPGLNPLRYTSIPFGQWVAADGMDGRIDQFGRCMKLTARQIMAIPDVKPSEDIIKAAEKEPLKEFEIIHFIMPREDYSAPKSKVMLAKDMPFESCWIERDKCKVIKESGYRKFPVALARYTLISGETYARGPAELALPDTKSLNQADQKALLKWDRELDPPTTTLEHSLVGRVLNKRAGGNTIVKKPDSVKPLFENGNWQAHDLMAERKEQAILRIFHVNEILNLLARESPEMTAFEVNARLTLLQQILGPVFGLLNADFLEVIVDVTLDIMAYAGMLDEAPDGVSYYDIVYEGPLAKAQRNGEITAIQQTFTDMAGMQPLYPNITLMMDENKTFRQLAEIRGTAHLLKSEDDLQEEMDQRIQQQNAEKATALVAGGAEALGKAAPGITALDEVRRGQQAA